MNRRDLLKYFSIGTAITPFASADSTPIVARLIEEPKLEVVKATEASYALMPGVPLPGRGSLKVIFKNEQGEVYTFEAKTAFIERTAPAPIYVTTHQTLRNWQELTPGLLSEFRWELRGTAYGEDARVTVQRYNESMKL